MHTNGYSGPIAKSALVKTNDPERSKTIIDLKLKVIPIFSRPQEQDLVVRTTLGRPVSVSTVITRNVPGNVRIIRIDHSFGTNAEAKVETIDPGKKYRVTLSATARQRVKWGGRVVLDLEGAPVPVFSIPAFVEVGD